MRFIYLWEMANIAFIQEHLLWCACVLPLHALTESSMATQQLSFLADLLMYGMSGAHLAAC